MKQDSKPLLIDVHHRSLYLQPHDILAFVIAIITVALNDQFCFVFVYYYTKHDLLLHKDLLCGSESQ